MSEWKEYKFFNLDGDLLKSRYGVYVVEIKIKDDVLYYVGQTGNNGKHLTARSPFHRFAAHLNYRSSTDNQIYKAIMLRYDINSKQGMEELLRDTKFNVHYFTTDNFEFLENENFEHVEKHTSKKEYSKQIEKAIILKMYSLGYILLNNIPLKSNLEEQHEKFIKDILIKIKLIK